MSTSNASSLLIPKRPIGPFRGSVLGFLAGVCTVSAIGFYTLFDKYTTASASLLRSVEELKANSVHLETYSKRIERLEQQYKQLAATSAKQTELQRVEKDARNLYDEVHLANLDIKRIVWGLEEDTRSLLQDRNRTIRIS